MPSPTPLDDRVWSRRIRTVPAVLLGAPVAYLLMVVAIPLSVVVDLARRKVRLPIARTLLFAAWYLGWEVIAVVSAGLLWVASGFGLALTRPAFIAIHRRIQVAWATSLIGAMRRFLSLRIEATGLEHSAPGPVVLLVRHASLVDTLLPLKLLSPLGLDFRYVLKTELLWDPSLDIYAHRIPDHFVDRSGTDTARELAAVATLSAGLEDSAALVIFPEGSRFTEAKRARALERLRGHDPSLAEIAEEFATSMPPRTGGTLTAINARPDADIAVMAHTGLEGLAGLKDLIATVPFRRPVKVEVWRIPRDRVPDDPADQRRWLFDTWKDVDDWVVKHQM